MKTLHQTRALLSLSHSFHSKGYWGTVGEKRTQIIALKFESLSLWGDKAVPLGSCAQTRTAAFQAEITANERPAYTRVGTGIS